MSTSIQAWRRSSSATCAEAIGDGGAVVVVGLDGLVGDGGQVDAREGPDAPLEAAQEPAHAALGRFLLPLPASADDGVVELGGVVLAREVPDPRADLGELVLADGLQVPRPEALAAERDDDLVLDRERQGRVRRRRPGR